MPGPVLLAGSVPVDPARVPTAVLQPLPASVEVSDDPALIAWIRQAHEADRVARFKECLQRLRQGQPTLEKLPELELRPGEAVAILLVLIQDDYLSRAAQVEVARHLLPVDRPEVPAFLCASLEYGDNRLRTALLEGLQRASSSERDALLRNADVARQLLLCLQDPDPSIIRSVAHLCCYHALPGAEDALRTVLEQMREWPELLGDAITSGLQLILPKRLAPLPSYRHSVASALVRNATTADSVRLAVRFLTRDWPYPDDAFRHLLSSPLRYPALQNPDPAVTDPLRQALRADLLRYPGSVRQTRQWILDFAAVAEVGDEALLERIASRTGDAVKQAIAVEGLARLHPDAAVARCLEQIQGERPAPDYFALAREYYVHLLLAHATEEDAERICAVLYPETRYPRQLDTADFLLLSEKLGERGRQRLASLRDRLDPFAQELDACKRQGLDGLSALAELHAAGLLRESPEEVFARMTEKCARDGEPPPDPTTPVTLSAALQWAGLSTLLFNMQGIPCRHEPLLAQIASTSRGRFTPEYPIQVGWVSDPWSQEQSAVVLFLAAGRAYRFPVVSQRFHCDLRAVLNALNFALEQNDRAERYLTQEMCEVFMGMVRIAFADPTVLGPLARKYGLSLTASASQAIRTRPPADHRVFNQPRDIFEQPE
jgi:hypothetical protein